ncbi:anti-sigma-I factor RsgI family protein [Salinithrix halophila]|uniref:Anti-sigma factor domain-containing protein n=1 Tax=Salinithrix halophila TaxID=1485204 RepID=A0ABV8JBK0_9BACL
MPKGIVMEVGHKHWVVMTPEGEFLKVPKQEREVDMGEEIHFALEKKPFLLSFWTRPTSWMTGGLAAAVLLLALLNPFWDPAKAHAESYIYIDLNPSLELGLNQDREVVRLRALNPEAKRLVSGMDWEGAKAADVVVDVLNLAKKAHYLDHKERVLISEVDSIKEPEKASGEALSLIKEEVQQNPELKRTNLSLYTIPLPEPLKEKAEKKGISPAKYAVGLFAKRNGHKLSMEQVAEMSITDLMKQVDLSPVLRNPPSDEEWATWIEEEDGEDNQKDGKPAGDSEKDEEAGISEEKPEGREEGKSPNGRAEDHDKEDGEPSSTPNEEEDPDPSPDQPSDTNSPDSSSGETEGEESSQSSSDDAPSSGPSSSSEANEETSENQ